MENSATAEGRTPKPDLSTPPRGVTVSRSLISGIETVYRRINPVAFFLVPFTGLWSGFSLWGIYGSQWTSGKFDPVMERGAGQRRCVCVCEHGEIRVY